MASPMTPWMAVPMLAWSPKPRARGEDAGATPAGDQRRSEDGAAAVGSAVTGAGAADGRQRAAGQPEHRQQQQG